MLSVPGVSLRNIQPGASRVFCPRPSCNRVVLTLNHGESVIAHPEARASVGTTTSRPIRCECGYQGSVPVTVAKEP